MNKNIMEAAGFGDEVAEVEAGRCPFCHKEINMNSFKDALSLKEYYISGLCQNCQNQMFG
jgi:uncharacterized CHY-type Zn-finger protein